MPIYRTECRIPFSQPIFRKLNRIGKRSAVTQDQPPPIHALRPWALRPFACSVVKRRRGSRQKDGAFKEFEDSPDPLLEDVPGSLNNGRKEANARLRRLGGQCAPTQSNSATRGSIRLARQAARAHAVAATDASRPVTTTSTPGIRCRNTEELALECGLPTGDADAAKAQAN